MYTNYPNTQQSFVSYDSDNDDRIIGGGFAAPFLLGGLAGAAFSPYRPYPYYRPFYPYYRPFYPYYRPYRRYYW